MMNLYSIILENAVQNLMYKIKIDNKDTWRNKLECDLLSELVLCILSSNIKYEVALLYTIKLKDEEYIKKAINNELEVKQLYKCLLEPISINENLIRYRFPKSKSEQLFKTIKNIYGNKRTIKEILINAETSSEARNSLISICVGMGYKQSSMFLRNIGFCFDLAIIDTHIIDYLKLVDVLPSEIGDISKSTYLKIESLYSKYAKSKQFDINKLDVAIWNVMKVYKTEFV
ncbi:MAG: hypothetical protein VB011_01535 [Bacteroidales bacterium]|nr:hypothetical protein [Bacteroidales bacterium]